MRTEDTVAEPSSTTRRERNRQAVELLRRWSEEDDDYDGEIWPLLEAELKDHPLAIR